MAPIQSPKPVVLLLTVCSRHPSAIEWSVQQGESCFGPVELASDRFDFEQTDYYEKSMGTGLLKQFFAFRQLIDPGSLRKVKIQTNQWEEQYRQQSDWPELRPLNLDPGYLSEGKLVLASTKNHWHRIYLDEGIYAEVTLRYQGRKWQKLPWTYPDYQQEVFHSFFEQCRNYLRRELRHG
jgi:hypothetical protein